MDNMRKNAVVGTKEYFTVYMSNCDQLLSYRGEDPAGVKGPF